MHPLLEVPFGFLLLLFSLKSSFIQVQSQDGLRCAVCNCASVSVDVMVHLAMLCPFQLERNKVPVVAADP